VDPQGRHVDSLNLSTKNTMNASKFQAWQFRNLEELERCRIYTNYAARKFLAERGQASDQQEAATGTPAASSTAIPVSHYCCQDRSVVYEKDYANEGPWESSDGNSFIDAAEEQLLVNFYLSKLPALIGPAAQVQRLRRDSKVLATSAMLYRRFFTSNSVLLFDPKAILVAAAFLGSKVEDAMAPVHHLEEGIVALDAVVSTQEIMAAEVALISGVNFDLLCFHPYKAVVSLTEDLRTFLKTAAGQGLTEQPITGQDLKPVYDRARAILEDNVVSDLPLVFSPSQIGMAALMCAAEHGGPNIDFQNYLQARFPNQPCDKLSDVLPQIVVLLNDLKEGKHGCGNYKIAIDRVKRIHKRLKKVRTWGEQKSTKKKKKRAHAEGSATDGQNQETKRQRQET
jgi:cyclin H